MPTFDIDNPPDKDEGIACDLLGTADLIRKDSSNYVEALKFNQDLARLLSAATTTLSPHTASLLFETGTELLKEFTKRNINFYEREHKIMGLVYKDLHFAQQQLESLSEFLEDPEKLLPEWCSPRRPDLMEMAQEIGTFMREAEENLAETQTRYANYLRECHNNDQAPNDPLARLRHCLTRAVKQTTVAEASIHQFNWARHITRIIISFEDDKGVNFAARRALRPLEATLRRAEKLFYRLKDDIDGYNDIEDIEDAEMSEHAARAAFAERESIWEQARPGLEKDFAELRELFLQGLTCLENIAQAKIALPEQTRYWNDDLDSSWFLERDDLREQRQQVARSKRKTREQSARRSADSSNNSRRYGHNSHNTDLIAAGVAVGLAGGMMSGMGGMGD